uniref:Uncharacterized protein n=2 Tax=Meloidogyne TaxID=189290 RepID=A0A6V7TRW4_MELEN|nr:unnamed protein product [Meloidogyne enterolobii]
MALNPGNWWYYFDRQNKSTAKCKIEECNYVKDTGKSYSTECLKSHLQKKHPKLYKQRQDYVADELKRKEKALQNKEISQKSEVEVNEFLRDSKLKVTSNSAGYWKVNAEKWPLLGKLVKKYHCTPATSCESERLFSTAGLIATDLRKSLLPENLEMLLTLHHNLLIYNFNYCLK